MSTTSTKRLKAPTKTPEEVPEVKVFLESFQQLEAFRAKHADVFNELEKIASDYNQKLQDASMVCRAQGVSCGPFDLYQYGTTYDAKTLFDLVGHDRFLHVGGSVSTETVYSVDKARIEAAINQGNIPSDAVDAFRKVTPRYHAPEPVKL